jgi:hypothetical protein
VQDASGGGGGGNLFNVFVENVKVKRICKGIECESADWISEFEWLKVQSSRQLL